QAFLDFQIVEEALHPFLVFSSHASSIPVSFPVSREQIANWVRRRGTAIGVPAARGVRAAGGRRGLIVYPANSVSSHSFPGFSRINFRNRFVKSVLDLGASRGNAASLRSSIIRSLDLEELPVRLVRAGPLSPSRPIGPEKTVSAGRRCRR